MQQVIYPPFSVWLSTFLHNTFFSGLIIFVLGLLFVSLLMWAEHKAERDAWEQQKTRKLKVVRRW